VCCNYVAIYYSQRPKTERSPGTMNVPGLHSVFEICRQVFNYADLIHVVSFAVINCYIITRKP
jgi:hypothetical protein